MEGRFLRGVVVGGILSAALAMQWDTIRKRCRCLEGIKKTFLSAPAEKQHCGKGAKAPKARTRLMARRHRMN